MDSYVPPTLNVLTLGLDGAGKTVFLASLFHRMSVYRESHGFALRTTEELSASLLEQYQMIASPRQKFPLGNVAVQEYIFDCVYPTDHRQAAFCKIKYIDFAGGNARGRGDFEKAKLRDRVEEAHSILVMLDGRKILNQFMGIDDALPTIYADISNLLVYLGLCVGMAKPIHILITKADLLPPSSFSLTQIKDLLLEYDPFRSFVHEQTKKAKLRIIPVSSVGNDFVTYDPTTGSMKKKQGGKIQPVNVDLALSLSIHDHLSSLSKESGANVADVLTQMHRNRDRLGVKRTVAAVLMPWVQRVPAILLGTGLGKAALLTLLADFDHRIFQAQGDIQKEIEVINKFVTDRQTALLAAFRLQSHIVDNLDKKLPENLVIAGGAR